ncbi:MAG: ADP-glyceromanno-heptose 6-epimerase [Bacteroidota bacterium]
MIVITGAAGFIGSIIAGKLNKEGVENLVFVDEFNRPEKHDNYSRKQHLAKVERAHFDTWLDQNHDHISFIIHVGARTDTAEFDKNVFDNLNLNYSKMIWNKCTQYSIPMIYASSAATYGMGEHGYNDDHSLIEKLKPLNPYGESKNEFDKWVLKQTATPPFWAGFKFFNVYGPNEYHKGRMASVIFHSEKQIRETGKVKLFRSHRPDFEDGKQLRDFIYVKDVANVIIWFMKNQPKSGIYNLGTGKARSFYDLATATFRALNLEPVIEFVDTPVDIRDKYQYFTEANMEKVHLVGYNQPFTSLEDGITGYVKKYLTNKIIY